MKRYLVLGLFALLLANTGFARVRMSGETMGGVRLGTGVVFRFGRD